MDESLASFIIACALALPALLSVAWCIADVMSSTARAEALLRKHLTPAELTELDRSESLQVVSQCFAGRVYTIPMAGAVTVTEDGTPVMRLCIRTAEVLPGREMVLAHKI